MSVAVSDANTVKSFLKIPLPPDPLFAAWVDPGLMKTWLFKSAKSEIRRVEIDLRVGGRFSIQEVTADGEQIEHSGEYLTIERPRRLMFTLETPKRFDGVSTVSIDITAGGEGSWMSFAHTGVSKDVYAEAWRRMFRRLIEELG